MNKLILTIILLVISLGLTLSFTRSEYSKYRTVKAEAESYEAALEQAVELSNLRERLLADLNEIDINDRNRLEKFLPRSIDTVRLTIEISNIARNAGVEVNEFSFTENTNPENEVSLDDSFELEEVTPAVGSASQSGANYSLVDMNLVVSGTYDDFKAFVNNIEENLRLTDIQSFAVSEGENGENSYSIVLRTYWLGT